MRGSCVIILAVIFGVISGNVSAAGPRCEFELDRVDKLLRCYSLQNLTVLESFIGDDGPVKVQVVNQPLDTFHLSSARTSATNDG